MTIKIEDLVPMDAEITISGKTYELRKFTLADSVWMNKKMGGEDAVQQMFINTKMEQLAILLFRLLKDKTDFLPETVQGWDDDGEIIEEMRVTGPEKVLQRIKLSEQENVIHGLLETIGVSQPIIDELEEKEVKKKGTKSKTKMKTSPKTGDMSLTK